MPEQDTPPALPRFVNGPMARWRTICLTFRSTLTQAMPDRNLGKYVPSWLQSRAPLLAECAGWFLLLIWCGWWSASLHEWHLVGPRVWVPKFSYLGLDFLTNDQAVRHWVADGNPYREPYGDPLNRLYYYPPVNLVLFSWCALTSSPTAVVIWTGLLALLGVLAAAFICRSRRELSLVPLPLSLVAGTFLLSTPMLFAMERGNSDLLVVGLVIAAGLLMRFPSRFCEILAGVAIATGIWIKLYPALLLVGLAASKKWRTLVSALIACIVIGLASLPYLPEMLQNMQVMIAQGSHAKLGGMSETTHSFAAWKYLFAGTPLHSVGELPGPLVWGALVFLPVLFVSWRVYRSPDSPRLLVPYLLWVGAAATFLPAIANDYSLVFLPLAVLALWDRRDSFVVHVTLIALMLWWEPFCLPLVGAGRILFACKWAGLMAVGSCLLNRLREQEASLERTQLSSPPQVHRLQPAGV